MFGKHDAIGEIGHNNGQAIGGCVVKGIGGGNDGGVKKEGFGRRNTGNRSHACSLRQGCKKTTGSKSKIREHSWFLLVSRVACGFAQYYFLIEKVYRKKWRKAVILV